MLFLGMLAIKLWLYLILHLTTYTITLYNNTKNIINILFLTKLSKEAKNIHHYHKILSLLFTKESNVLVIIALLSQLVI